MAAELPEIADLADRLLLDHWNLISGIIRLRLLVQAFDSQIDLANVKTRCLEIEAEIEDRELFELFGQQPVVPGCVFRQPIVGDLEGAPLRGIEMVDRDHRDLAPAELLRRQNPYERHARTQLCRVFINVR
jgi:hypothetical protein